MNVIETILRAKRATPSTQRGERQLIRIGIRDRGGVKRTSQERAFMAQVRGRKDNPLGIEPDCFSSEIIHTDN